MNVWSDKALFHPYVRTKNERKKVGEARPEASTAKMHTHVHDLYDLNDKQVRVRTSTEGESYMELMTDFSYKARENGIPKILCI